jgi:hypothetical protein
LVPGIQTKAHRSLVLKTFFVTGVSKRGNTKPASRGSWSVPVQAPLTLTVCPGVSQGEANFDLSCAHGGAAVSQQGRGERAFEAEGTAEPVALWWGSWLGEWSHCVNPGMLNRVKALIEL